MAAALSVVCGCDLPDRPDVPMLRKPPPWERPRDDATSSTSSRDLRGLASLVSTAAPSAPFPRVWETRELRFLRDQVIGTTHLVSELSEGDEIIVTVDQRVRRDVGPVSWVESTEQKMLHDSEGRLLRMDSRWRTGPMRREQVLRIVGDAAEIDNRWLTTASKVRLNLPADFASPLIVYQTLLRQPMQAHQVRKFDVIVPAIARLAHLELACGETAAIAGLEPGPRSLSELRVVSRIGDERPRTMFHWFDDSGMIQKSNVAGDRDSSFRCSEDQFNDLGREILSPKIPLSVVIGGKPIPTKPLKQMGLEIKVPARPPAATGGPANQPDPTNDSDWDIPPAPRQYVQRIDDQTIRVIISEADVPREKLAGRFAIYDEPPTDGDLARTQTLDFLAPEITKVLQALVVNGLNPQEICLETNGFVHSLLGTEPFSEGVRPASQIANSSLADPTEQSILLMALLRARKIPCRLVMGLRGAAEEEAGMTVPAKLTSTKRADVPKPNRFVYHAWVIGWAADHWLAIDPATGDTTQPDCLAIHVDSLQDADPERLMQNYFAKLLPLKIDVFAAVPR